MALLCVEPPGPPTNIRAECGSGFVRLFWDPPTFTGGGQIVKYTISSRIFGENKLKAHKGLRIRDSLRDPPNLGVRPYATLPVLESVEPRVDVQDLSEGRVYGFNVVAHTMKFSSEVSQWSNHVRPAVRQPEDKAKQLQWANQHYENLHWGQDAYQGSYFVQADTRDGWHLEILEGIRNSDWSRLQEGCSMPGADINSTFEYDRNVPKNERTFRYGPVELTLFDSISDLDSKVSTGDTPLMLALKYCNIDCINVILNFWPDLTLRNCRDQNAIAVAAKYNLGHTLEPIVGYKTPAQEAADAEANKIDFSKEPVHSLVTAKLA
jgi:hypothetical protein